jgi:hypothetical protein
MDIMGYTTMCIILLSVIADRSVRSQCRLLDGQALNGLRSDFIRTRTETGAGLSINQFVACTLQRVQLPHNVREDSMMHYYEALSLSPDFKPARDWLERLDKLIQGGDLDDNDAGVL